MNAKRILFGSIVILSLMLAACGPSSADMTATAGGNFTTPTSAAATQTTDTTAVATSAATADMTVTAEGTLITTPVEGTSTAMPAGTTTPSTAEEPVLIRASDLIGMPIVTQADTETEIGVVEEVLVDQDGMVQFLVFDADTLLATGPQMVAVPFENFEIEPGDEHLTFTGTEAEVQSATVIDATVTDDDDFVVGGEQGGTPAPSEFRNLIRVSRFTDFDLRNADDEDLGEVEDLVINVRQGEVEDTIVNFGGFLGIGEKAVAVPWEGLQLNTDTENQQPFFLLDVQPEMLEQAPAIEDMDETLPRWPETINPNWDNAADSFWQTAGVV
jgi:sporulation protein YlmC with PRC-barrel domain